MADKTTENIKKLMQDPTKIRNVGVCAHIDHGKCVRADSRLQLADGSILMAEELYSLAQKNGSLFEKNEKYVIYDVTSMGLTVFSLNKESGEIEKKSLSLAWKLKGGDMIELTTRNGYKIATTPEHKYIVYDNVDFVEKQAAEIKLGDRVVCARNLETKSNMNIKKEILTLMSKKRFYVRLNVKNGKGLKKKILAKGLENVYEKIKTNVKLKSFYHGVWQGRFLLKDFISVMELFSYNYEQMYDQVDSIVYREGGHRGKNSLPMKMPKNMKDFFYLAGLMIGDGHEKKFIVGKPELGKIFTNTCNSLGISVSLRDYGVRTPELVSTRTLSEILNSLFDYPLKAKSHNVSISRFLQKAPKKLGASFLKGYYDTDGSVELSRRAVTISSASDKMIKDLSLFLVRYGCVPIIEIDNTITLSGQSMVNFVQQIGFNVEHKMDRAKDIVGRMNGSLVADYIPVKIINSDGSVVMQKQFGPNKIEKFEAFCQDNGYSQSQLKKILSSDLAYIEVKSLNVVQEEVVYDFTVPGNHNFIAEGMAIHNTTFSDNLLAGAGMLSENLAGQQRALDFHDDEAERGITIDSANVSMVHSVEGEDYLINLIDTPGHVDFGGDVTRAMRAVDGAIVLSCAVEGIMPQTETVLRQALKELVKPVLFINKVDRLIKEVKLTPEAMTAKFVKIIDAVNKLIAQLAPEGYGSKWQLSVQEGSVAFGSAYHNWALSFPYMKKKGLTFKDVIEAYENDTWKELAKKAPLHEVVLNMVIGKHPNPKNAQEYRIPRIWHGDKDTELAKSLMHCDPNGPAAFVVTKIVIDKHAGEVAAGRLFSGKISQGMEVYMNMAKKKVRVQQVGVYKGAKRVALDTVYPGNIVGIVGLKGVFSGETISAEEMEPFEAIKHIFDPVITKSIEVTNSADLPKLIDILGQVGKEDPSIKIEINEETGENLISGMGELHLEIIENRIKTEKGLTVKTSPPIVVYRETVKGKSTQDAEGKSPNKHNRLYFSVEPLDDNIYEALKKGDLPEGRIRKKDKEIVQKLIDLGLDTKEAKSYVEFYNGNAVVDNTRGIVHIGEIIGLVMDGFEQVMQKGALAQEPVMKVKVRLMDCKLHEDSIHRGPAQMYPAVREGIRGAMNTARPVLYEPLQLMQVDAPGDYMGDVSKIVQNKRGQLISMDHEGAMVSVKAMMPVAELFGWSSDLRSATSGRGSSFIIDQKFDALPENLQPEIVKQIRQRKGLDNPKP